MASSSPSFGAQAYASLMLALPIIAGQLALVGMGVVATLLMGRIGAEAMAAGVLGNALFFSITIIINGVLSSIGVLVAQAEGQGDSPRSIGYVQRGAALALLLSLPACVILSASPSFFLAIGQAPEQVARMGHYLEALSFALPLYSVVLALRYFFAAAERPMIGTLTAILGVGVEFAVGQWLLPMGIFGVGLAVTAGCAAMLGGSLAYLRFSASLRAYDVYRRGRTRPGQMGDLWRIGWPMGIAFGAETLFFMLTTTLAGYFSIQEVAAHSIAYQSVTTAFMIAVGLSHATMVRVARAMGEGDRLAVRRIGWAGIMLGCLGMGSAGLLLALGGRWIAAHFLDPAIEDAGAVINFAAPLLAIAALFQWLDGTQAIAAGALRGLKDTRGPLVISIIAYWPIGMACGGLLAFGYDLRLIGLWSGLALGLAAAALALTFRFHLKSRSLPRLRKT